VNCSVGTRVWLVRCQSSDPTSFARPRAAERLFPTTSRRVQFYSMHTGRYTASGKRPPSTRNCCTSAASAGGGRCMQVQSKPSLGHAARRA
jgi:hypothetical protein